ncbi:transposase [Undibacterium sp. Di24W]|uniref:transposase n=1 Tax=Undibacterium sp. Di24W TaxID=3413033 RepID=UPI003BF15C7D
MARLLRIEYAGALYHVTARGNARANIYGNDDDSQRFLSLLKIVVDRYDWYCHAYCLMDNHYHLLIETNRASLSDDRWGSVWICQDQEYRTAALS